MKLTSPLSCRCCVLIMHILYKYEQIICFAYKLSISGIYMDKKMSTSYIFELENTHWNASHNSISWHPGWLIIKSTGRNLGYWLSGFLLIWFYCLKTLLDKNPQVSKAPPLFQLMNPKGQTVLSKVVWKAGWGGEGTRVEGTFLGLIIKVSTGLKKAECIYNLEWRT